ncbi:MAG: hypothetical protein ACLSTJ_16710 [Clostridium neonatale]
MNKIESKIATRYNNSMGIAKRKNITFNIDEESLERLDSIVNFFYEKDGVTTRNAVIEDAIMAYIESAEDFFEKQNVNNDTNDINNNDVGYDTAVFPATNSNFGKVFIGEKKWYYVRIAAYRVENIEYVALYRGAPVSAITHYAKVIKISEPNEDNKRLINLEEPIALAKPIKLGDIHVNNVRKLFYTTLQKLQNSDTVKELLE